MNTLAVSWKDLKKHFTTMTVLAATALVFGACAIPVPGSPKKHRHGKNQPGKVSPAKTAVSPTPSPTVSPAKP
jgi:hypothetical protein